MSSGNAGSVRQDAYVYLDGIWIKWGLPGEALNIAVHVALGVKQQGIREILGVAERI